jgi:hypothetical protein
MWLLCCREELYVRRSAVHSGGKTELNNTTKKKKKTKKSKMSVA